METITFTCACGNTREVHNAARHEVTRCEDCQIEHKRRKARERYRKRKGLPLDYVPPARVKKAIIANKPVEESKSSWLDVKKAPAPAPEMTPEEMEEQVKRQAALEGCFAMLDDDSDDSDW